MVDPALNVVQGCLVVVVVIVQVVLVAAAAPWGCLFCCFRTALNIVDELLAKLRPVGRDLGGGLAGPSIGRPRAGHEDLRRRSCRLRSGRRLVDPHPHGASDMDGGRANSSALTLWRSTA